MNEVLNALGLIGAAAAGLASLYAIALFFTRHMRRVSTVLATVESMASEFRPNGGSTMRDLMNRVELSVAMGNARDRSAIQLMGIAIYETDQRGMCYWASDRWLEMTGLTFEEARGYGWHMAIHDDDRQRVVAEWKAAIADQRNARIRYRYRRDDSNEIMEITETVEPVRNVIGDMIGLIGCVEISTRKTLTGAA